LHPILAPEVESFIDANIGNDISKLALQKNPFPETDWKMILNQIEAKTKAKDKLPNWYKTEKIIYPQKISIEQTSSEKTAQYKSALVSGKTLIDLTGGFGVDDFYFSKQMEKVIHCEINDELSQIVKHNYEQFGISNIECISGDGTQTLRKLQTKFDWIYIDPSRRHDAKGKVFMLKDCLPDVPGMLEFYFNYTNNLLLKTAPILDIAAGLSELKYVTAIHIVAVNNEVKELLWEIKKNYVDDIMIKTINLNAQNTEVFDFLYQQSESPFFETPLSYLYEPNAAIMKSGGFDEVSVRFYIAKLHQHSHLYTSNHIIDFPGRVFKIEKTMPYQKSQMQALQNTKANITTRNFPDSVDSIRKKWKIKDGGDRYCFFTTDKNNNKIVLICTKIK